MKNKGLSLFNLILMAGLLFSTACAEASTADTKSSNIVLVGSTPGESLIKSLLAINYDGQIDFIRWDLTLNEDEKFILNINFGEGQPNTNGFKSGGQRLSLTGTYTVSKNIYKLKDDRTGQVISLVKLNENIFHLMTPEGKLMVGNGGWSYTLSKKEPDIKNSAVKNTLATSLPEETAQQVTFDGRTPCLDSAQFKLPISDQCLKIKWKITLLRDINTGQPTAFALDSTINRTKPIEGKWKIVKGTKNNPEALIYRLDFEEYGESLSFLVGDENVLFFLDKENQPLTGNSDFSFTLNRRK